MKKIALSERLSKDVSLITHRPVSEEAFKRATQIVDDVRSSGDKAVISYGELFNELRNGQVVFSKAECEEVCKRINVDTLGLFTRCCERVRQFAAAQRGSIREVEIDIQGGSVGHRIIPVNRAGCYVPGGRYPLVSSLIMSVVTARAAGVKDVWVATPRPSDEMLAASFIAGADGVIGVGGAHAIAALAYGFKDLKGCDCIVGPGNSFVTAAKHIVSSVVKIDMLAGPSELLVIADDTASPSLVAADLLAQAEHDTEAVPILISTSRELVDLVQEELNIQTRRLSSAGIIEVSITNGFFTVVDTLEMAAELSNIIAPEHLQLSVKNPEHLATLLTNYGGLFIGEGSAEVIGDYCAGPNHVLPTGGTGRFRGGLSVFDFLKVATWLRIDDTEKAANLYDDAMKLGKLEGLEGHYQAAKQRLKSE